MAAATLRLCAVGGAVVDFYADLGRCFPGGNAPNVAVHAARGGADAAFFGAIGSDQAGDHFRASLREEGVDLSRVQVHKGPTPMVTVRRARSGEYQCVACPAYRLPLEFDTADADHLVGFDLIHTAGTSRLTSQVPFLADRGRLSYDFSNGPAADDEGLLPLVWMATLSRPAFGADEAADLCRWVQRKGPRLVLVTCGRAGATAACGRALHHEPAAPGPVVDALGAGDAFLARMAMGVLSGDGLAEAMAAAAGYSALVCSSPGAFGHPMPCPGIPPLPVPDVTPISAR
jgi:fructoselysine 6-kinase